MQTGGGSDDWGMEAHQLVWPWYHHTDIAVISIHLQNLPSETGRTKGWYSMVFNLDPSNLLPQSPEIGYQHTSRSSRRWIFWRIGSTSIGPIYHSDKTILLIHHFEQHTRMEITSRSHYRLKSLLEINPKSYVRIIFGLVKIASNKLWSSYWVYFHFEPPLSKLVPTYDFIPNNNIDQKLSVFYDLWIVIHFGNIRLKLKMRSEQEIFSLYHPFAKRQIGWNNGYINFCHLWPWASVKC